MAADKHSGQRHASEGAEQRQIAHFYSVES